MKVSETHLINRMRWYLKAKIHLEDGDRWLRAEATCRDWLKWAGWFNLSHKKRSELYNIFKKS